MKKTLQLLLLLSGKRSYKCKELATRFDVSERQIYRYLDDIEESGFVIDRTNGTYILVRNKPNYKSLNELLHFSEEEAYILYRTLSKIEVAEPIAERLVKKLHTLYDFKAFEKIKETKGIEKLNRLAEAIREKKQVILHQYRSSNRSEITDRKVEAFEFMSDYRAVWCFDDVDITNKQFKISRIERVEILNESWLHESSHKIQYTDAFRMSGLSPIATIEAILSLKAYNLLKEEFPLSENFIVKQDENYLLKIPVADFHGIGRFVLGLPGEIEVLSPIEFKEFLMEKAKIFLR